MKTYRDRMTHFVWLVTAYGLGGAYLLKMWDAAMIGWLVYASTITLMFAVAIAADAVYDSLKVAEE